MQQIERHHRRGEVATNRPAYREARREKAVKVYTVNQESKYLLVQNVHALGVTQELLQLFSLYGDIQEYRVLDEYPSEPYTDVYWVKFVDIAAARVAKRKLDDHSFFGKNLHVSYAPEFESVEETREKLQERRDTIAKKLKASHVREKKPQVQREMVSRSEQQTNVIPISTTAAFSNPSVGTQSLTIQPSTVISPEPLSRPTASLSQPELGNTQTAMSQSQYMYQVPPPPLPDPVLQGMHAAQYPSQSTQNILGGVLPIPSTTHGKADLTSRHHPQATTQSREGGERDRAPKRRLENVPSVFRERSSGEEGLYDASGLSTSQRVTAFLSTSSGPGISNLSTAMSKSANTEQEPPVKKKAHERPKEPQTDRTVPATQQSSSRTEKIPVPSEGYFPVHQLPPLQSGSRSVDATVQTVRKRMDKVWNSAVHTPSIPQVKKPKKRKRI